MISATSQEGVHYPQTQSGRLAFTSAQAWGVDLIFDELFREREGFRAGLDS
jgi:hypothetical protein